MKNLILLLVCVLVVCSLVFTQVPNKISYQGLLTTSSGTPVQDGSYTLKFDIFSLPTGGSSLWTETFIGMSVSHGVFNVILGTTNPMLIPFNDSMYVEVMALGGPGISSPLTFSPRSTLASAPYALQSRSLLGKDCAATGTEAIAGGRYNFARGAYSVVVGGGGSAADSNSAIGDYSTISGGKRNKSTANYAVIGGGSENTASGLVATVGGGYLNSSSGNYATVGGGYYNATSGERAMVGGGSFNGARGSYSVVSGGGGGSIADSNSALGDYSAIGGGRRNIASGYTATVGGGYSNMVNGQEATVSGGNDNIATSWCATVGGGYTNTASNVFATVGGGGCNNARGQWSVVSGGGGSLLADSNSALGDYSTVSGGRRNIANGFYSMISGGVSNTTVGSYSFAAGRRAKALHDGSFVWGDATDADFSSTANNQFIIRASAGVGIGASPTAMLDVNGMARIRNLPVNTGTTVVTDGGGNLFRSASSRRYKDNIRPLSINAEDVMKLQPVRFQYRETHVEDIGLIAEDVDEVFKDLVIYDSEGKPDAVKYDRIAVYLLLVVKEQQKGIEELNARNEKLEARLVELEAKIKD